MSKSPGAAVVLKFFITLLVDPSTPRPRRQCDLSELLHEFPEVLMMISLGVWVYDPLH
jgi:hypothetical protein